MIPATKLLAALSLAVLFGAVATSSASPTFLNAASSGKRLVAITDKDVTPVSTGKIALYIQGNNLLTDIHAPAVLVVDGADVRPNPAGLVLATFDGENIRHGRRGKIIINYRHPEICPDPAANRIYIVEGPMLSKQQLVAALYVLQPELFALTAEEEAAQKKDRAENAAESDREAAADHVAGNWMVLNGSGPAEHIGNGSIVFSPKKGEAYQMALDYTKNGGPAWNGVAVAGKVVSDEQPIWAAYGTPKTVAMCVYDISGGTLTGKWYPWYADGDPKNLGSESLTGPATLDGEYKIVSGQAATTGTPYTGTVTIKPLAITGAADDSKPYLFTWDFAGTKVYGMGIRTGNRMFVATGAGADVVIAKFTLHNGSFNGDFYKRGSLEMGSTAATSMN